LTYGDESNDENVKFKETVLPPGMLDKPRDEVIGVTVASPEVNVEKGIRGPARKSTVATGDETWSRNVRPRHRSVVRKYFDDREKTKP
jgi:hypothetical protein